MLSNRDITDLDASNPLDTGAAVPSRSVFEGDTLYELLHPPSPATNEHWAIKKALERIDQLKTSITEIAERDGVDLGEVEVFLNGSMATGLFTGVKPRQHSLNTDAPSCEMVVEADLRVLIGENADPHDPRVLAVMREALGGDDKIQSCASKVIMRWAAPINMSYFYQYEQIDDRTSFEWEVCINKKPYVEIAHIWDKIFAPHEIEWQLQGRSALRSMRVDLKDEFEPAKKVQCNECRWRIVGAYAVNDLHSKGQLIMDAGAEAAINAIPLKDQPPKMINFLIDAWLAGQSGMESLDRPLTPFLPQSMVRIADAAEYVESAVSTEQAEILRRLLVAPPAPTWVNLCGSVQEALQSRTQSGKSGRFVLEIESLANDKFRVTPHDLE